VPIVYLHGVAIRDQTFVPMITSFLRHYVAPAIAPTAEDAHRVRIIVAQWGGHAVQFAWNHTSLPADDTPGVKSQKGMPLRVTDMLKLRQSTPASENVAPLVWSLSADQLSSVLSAALKQIGLIGGQYATSATALDSAVRNLVTKGGVSAIDGALLNRIVSHAEQLLPDLEQSVNGKLHADSDEADHASLSPVSSLTEQTLRSPGEQLSLLATDMVLRFRPAIDAVITNFIGDVFVYLAKRGEAEAPGQIITDFLDALLEAKQSQAAEPLVVLSHSMGGQIVYDCATYYIPRNPKYANITIDYWVSAASQVGLFEEMKLFKCSNPATRAPQKVVPAHWHVRHWYNVWDPHDILSYETAPIFYGADDERFESDLPIHLAHFGYLSSPVFYRRIGEKIRIAQVTASSQT